MKLVPLASDSMGARSMAFLVETRDCRILIDPGVSLGPLRYGLPPHEIEVERATELWDAVTKAAKMADVAIISHYHYDHHEPEEPYLLRGKRLFIKDPKSKINASQRGRAAEFLGLIKGVPTGVEIADGATVEIGSTTITFSGAVPHGTNPRLGYVIETAVCEGSEAFVHTSDVEGPSLDEQVEFIIAQQPSTVACDGPMTYMMHRYGRKALERSIANLTLAIERTGMKVLILDHHLLRDLRWAEKVAEVIKAGEAHGCSVQTFAEFAGMENELLEARRKELYEMHPMGVRK
ncbi:MAG: hypothetical protein AB1665_00960 [Candidatus Thermoplasmatota archaeon]